MVKEKLTMAKRSMIRCPFCGAEYLPSEIYVPDVFLGRPLKVYRDERGTILGSEKGNMDLKEVYTCDYCNKKFTVEASVIFKSEPAKDIFDN